MGLLLCLVGCDNQELERQAKKQQEKIEKLQGENDVLKRDADKVKSLGSQIKDLNSQNEKLKNEIKGIESSRKDNAELKRTLAEKDTILELKKELGEEFIFGYLKPFVIAGNISQQNFDQIKNGTLTRCSTVLYKDCFNKKPAYPIRVYLFRDAASYEAYCMKTWRIKPTTPYGFYEQTSNRLVMNIATGTGTLVHEMAHALIEPDFPNVPAWFNEGSGTLYEQCNTDQTGSLRGLINWRYNGLMQAAQKNQLISLQKLMNLTDREFYGPNSGLHYAQARYFFLYLQENKVLPQFYKKFRDNFANDKNGIKLVEELLKKSIDEIDKNWRKWLPTVKNIAELR